jgi:hypothetical protein
MTPRNLIGLLFAFAFCCCSDESKQVHQKHLAVNDVNDAIRSYESKQAHQTHPGIYIANADVIQGGGYTDSLGNMYTYRYIRARIINDTLVPIHINIAFLKEHYFPSKEYSPVPFSRKKIKIFIQRQGSGHATNELKKFLDTALENPVTLDKIINPKETCIVNIGLLFDMDYGQPQVALFSKGQMNLFYSLTDSVIKPTVSVKNMRTLLLGVKFTNWYSIIPAGQISF